MNAVFVPSGDTSNTNWVTEPPLASTEVPPGATVVGSVPFPNGSVSVDRKRPAICVPLAFQSPTTHTFDALVGLASGDASGEPSIAPSTAPSGGWNTNA